MRARKASRSKPMSAEEFARAVFDVNFGEPIQRKPRDRGQETLLPGRIRSSSSACEPAMLAFDPDGLDEQIAHIVRVFFFHGHDANQHLPGRRVTVADRGDHLAVGFNGHAFGDQVGLDHVLDVV